MNDTGKGKTNGERRIDRVLSLFTEVKAGETKMALLMALTAFLILTSYLIAKVVREPLILSGGGAEMKTYESVFQVGLLLIVIRLYSMCVCKLCRRHLINGVTLFFVASLVIFWLTLTMFGPYNGIIYYLWTGLFSLLIIAQFWSFANDIYTPEQGKRLFVLLAFGASAGGVFGPLLAGFLLDLVGLYNLLLVAAGMLLSSLLLMNYIGARTYIEETHCTDTAGEEKGKAVGHSGALKVLIRNRYLLMIAFLILFSNWVNTTGEYILGRSVEETATALFAGIANAAELQQSYIGNFYANFYSIVGLIGLIIQLFIVSRVVKYLGVRFALMTLPVIALGGYALMAFIPVLGLIQWGKTAENSLDYSLNNTVRQILFLPTTREEKYKAKVAIDTLFVRAGDFLAAGLVFVGVSFLSLSLSQFAAVSIGLAIIWLVLAFFIGKENRRLVKQQAVETVKVREDGVLK